MYQGHTRYEEDIQQVLGPESGEGAVYIGNKEAAESSRTLARLGITGVLSAAKGLLLSHPSSLVPHYKYIPAEDHESYNLAAHFEEAGHFIREARKRGNVLVHCMAGVSRSVSLVVAYLLRHKGLSYEQAYARVKRARPIASPNSGFIQQLRNYALQLTHGLSKGATLGHTHGLSFGNYQGLAQGLVQRQSYGFTGFRLGSSHNSSHLDSAFQSSLRPRSPGRQAESNLFSSSMLSPESSYFQQLLSRYRGLPRTNELGFLSRGGGLGSPTSSRANLGESRWLRPGQGQLSRSGVRGFGGRVDEMSAKIEELRRKYLPDQSSRLRTVSSLSRSKLWL